MSARTRMIVALAAATAVLAGCASVPTEGQVRSGSFAADRRGDANLGVPAAPPRPSTAPRAIVSGFIDAMASSTDIARLYLTSSAARVWRPEQGTTIFDGTDKSAYRVTDGKNVELDAPIVANLDDRGVWRNAKPSTPNLKLDFGLVTENGEWRISNPPKGTLLQKSLQLLDPRNLYFFSPKLDVLVPEQVFLPRRDAGGQDATQLVRALLAGPTSRLGDSVKTAVPEGTEVVSVPVDPDGVATVSLNDRVAELDSDLRIKLAAQLAWTLKQAPGVRSLKLTVNGAPFEVGGTTEAQPVGNWDSYDPAFATGAGRLYVLDDSQIRRIDDVTAALAQAPDPVTLPGLGAFEKESLAVDIEGRTAAVVRSQNIVVGALETDRPQTPDYVSTDGEVLRPSFDKDGNLWVVDRAEDARIRVRRPDGAVIDVDAKGLAGRHVSVLRVARDGVRVLAVVKEQTRDLLMVGRITSTDKRKVKITAVEPVPVSFKRLADAGWSKPTKIMLVGGSGTGPNQMQELNVDGSQAAAIQTSSVEGGNAPTVFNPEVLATAPDPDALPVVQNASGEVLVRQLDLTWRVLMRSGTPIYAG